MPRKIEDEEDIQDSNNRVKLRPAFGFCARTARGFSSN
jgi:hypothetical protein